MKAWANLKHLFAALLFAAVAGGCASSGNPADPLEGMNRAVYKFNDVVDRAALKPVATAYTKVVPEPARQCIGNVFANISDVLVTVNSLLQGKVGDAIGDACRVLMNTTVGLGGCIDIASQAGLEKHNRDFGQTFGKWGVTSGPYLVLPFVGPSNFRDGAGYLLGSYLDPVWNIPHVPTRNVVAGIRIVDTRSQLLTASDVLEEAALDKYSFVRDAYMQRRQGMVEDDNNAAPPVKPGSTGDKPGDKKSSAPQGGTSVGTVVPADLWFDQANQRAPGAGLVAGTAKPGAPDARRGAKSAAAGGIASPSL